MQATYRGWRKRNIGTFGKISVTEKKAFDAEAFFNEASAKYGDVFKKLAT
jgi:hypothetical protein